MTNGQETDKFVGQLIACKRAKLWIKKLSTIPLMA
jgi:hypothetical protein